MKHIIKILLPALMLAFALPAAAQSPAAEFKFYKNQAASADKKMLEALAQSLQFFIARHADSPQAGEALLLKADTELKLKNFPAAAITLLRYKFEHGQPPKDMIAAAAKGLEKDKRTAFERLANANITSAELQPNLALFLAKATELDLKNTLAPLIAQYEQFFVRFPAFENNDRLELMQGDLYRQNASPRAAVMQYLKVYEVYPSTKFKAAALRMAGDVYGGDLKDYAQSMHYYEKVLKEYPTSAERGITYKHMAIMEENRKKYAPAADYAGKAADIFIKDGAAQKAYEALFYKADLQETRLKDYPAAIATLDRAANLFANNQAWFVETKLKTAAIYGKKLKDPYGQIKAYESIISAYPRAPQAIQVMFDTGQLYEKTNNPPKAKAIYQKLIVEYPADAMANKAQKRIDAIDKKAAKEGSKN